MYLEKNGRREGLDFEYHLAGDQTGGNRISWVQIGRYDGVFLHRPCREDDLTIIKIARDKNVPVWCEFDDDLFSVPIYNPHHAQYENPAMQNIIASCAALADMISVTTQPLCDLFKRVNDNVVIIPNAYRSDIYWYRKLETPPRNDLIAWRGSPTHDADLMSVANAWLKMPAKVSFYGGVPWMLTAKMQENKPGSFQSVGNGDPFIYMRELYNAAPRVMVVPLVDCFFNRCKSNIAYQEALHAGAICVAPNMPEWVRPGVVGYEAGNADSFLAAVNGAFNLSDDKHKEIVSSGYKEMREQYDAAVVNEVRKKALLDFVNRGRVNGKDPWFPLVGAMALTKLKSSRQQNSLNNSSIGRTMK
jgi:hypothetical protein